MINTFLSILIKIILHKQYHTQTCHVYQCGHGSYHGSWSKSLFWMSGSWEFTFAPLLFLCVPAPTGKRLTWPKIQQINAWPFCWAADALGQLFSNSF